MQDMLQLLRPRLTIIRLGAGKEKAPPPEETLDTFRAASGLEPAQVQQAWRILSQMVQAAMLVARSQAALSCLHPSGWRLALGRLNGP